MKQHKWHKEIKHLADGGAIEFRTKIGKNWSQWTLWNEEYFPEFNSELDEFRIKPQPKEPQYLYVYFEKDKIFFMQQRHADTKTRRCINYLGKVKIEVDE